MTKKPETGEGMAAVRGSGQGRGSTEKLLYSSKTSLNVERVVVSVDAFIAPRRRNKRVLSSVRI